MNFQKISDKNLYKICKKFGADALHARRKFAGLLPEVNKRKLYERHGFSSIYEFAARLAGMSREQVDQVLRLERNFIDKPVLRKALVDGEISASKLIRIASIATTENQESLFDAANRLSKQALDVFVKDYKSQKSSNKPLNEQVSLPGQTFSEQISRQYAPRNFDFEIIAAMSPQLKQKIKELLDKGQDINQIFLDLLQSREKDIAEEKEKIAVAHLKEKEEKSIIGMPVSRHIPAKTVRIISEEWGVKCAKPGCENIAQNIHHVRHFAKYRAHDPRYLKPFCRGHHELEHHQREYTLVKD